MNWSAIASVLTYVILGSLLLAAATDLNSRIIPNRLVVVVLCCGLGLRLVTGPRPPWASGVGAVVVLALVSALASRDFIGWGDAKLIAAVSFAVPAERLIPLLLAITLAGGGLSCVYLSVRFGLRRMRSPTGHARPGRPSILTRLARRERARILANEPMPYAVAIFGGVAYGLAAR